MRLAKLEQLVCVSEHSCSPAQFQLLPGGRVVLAVESGPPQSFSVGRGGGDVGDEDDEAFVFTTPAIPAGSTYEWCVALDKPPARLPA